MTHPAEQVRALLRIAADQMPGGPVDVRMPDLVRRARHDRRRRRVQLAAAFTAVLLAVAVPVFVSRQATRGIPLPGHASPTASPDRTGGTATLAHGHWTRLPTAPIAPRTAAATVWTGTRMVVWGGESATGDRYADGAAYDPGAGRWSMLPPGPLSARAEPANVWTGDALFVWGGSAVVDGVAQVDGDGALYHPDTGSWRPVARAPIAARTRAYALWTGTEVVVIGGEPADPNGPLRLLLDAAAYDPATDSWHRLPDLPVPASRTVDGLTAVATSYGVYAWVYWQRADGGTVTSGISQLHYDAASGRWQTTDKGVPRDLGTPLWTGRRVIFPAAQPFYGDVPGPYVRGTRGWSLDPVTGDWQRLPHGPVDDLDASSLWAGAALLSYNSRTLTSGSAGTVYPGAAALWEPATDRWTRLPDAPLAGLDPGAVWTGTEFLEWGLMVPNRTVGNGTLAEGGLSFGP